MPLIETQESTVPWYLFNRHLQTIVSTTYRQVLPVPYVREKIETPDGDFFHVDWSKVGSKTVVLLLHGLTGNSHRNYMYGMARAMNKSDYDVLAINSRGSSGEMNRKLESFHSGWTKDLRQMVQRLESEYDHICLVGFSMGGNIVLKYLGEEAEAVSPKVKATVAFSVPVHLASGVDLIDSKPNEIYQKRFLKRLKAMVKIKGEMHPGRFDVEKIESVSSLRELDVVFSSPVYGYPNPQAFYEDISSLYSLEKICVPSLLVNSSNDPFLSEKSFPREIAKHHKCFHLEITKNGGHVGFGKKLKGGMIWSERRATEFIKTFLQH